MRGEAEYLRHGESPLERYVFLTMAYWEGDSSTSLILSYISIRFLSITRILSLIRSTMFREV